MPLLPALGLGPFVDGIGGQDGRAGAGSPRSSTTMPVTVPARLSSIGGRSNSATPLRILGMFVPNIRGAKPSGGETMMLGRPPAWA